MNRSIIVALIVIVSLAAGAYLYLNSQKGKSEPHQTVIQSHRSYEIEVTSNATNIKPNQPIKFSYKIKNDKGKEFIKSSPSFNI